VRLARYSDQAVVKPHGWLPPASQAYWIARMMF
jgi:hypothetical protein